MANDSPEATPAVQPGAEASAAQAAQPPPRIHPHRIEHFEYDSDWHIYSLLTFARQTRDSLPDRTPSDLALRTLVDDFIIVADFYYCKGIALLERQGGHTPYDRQQVLVQVSDEWTNVLALIAHSRMLPENNDAVVALTYLVQKVCDDLHLDKQVIVLPQIGRRFSLITFNYAPDVTVLGIPLTSLYCPWEWSIVWHEVASLYLQSAAGKEIVDSVKHIMALLPANIWPVVPDETVFESWAQELVEDSVSVLCLGAEFVDSLDTFLAPFYADPLTSDPKHPPRRLRAEVARALHMHIRARGLPIDDGARPGADSPFAILSGVVAARLASQASAASTEGVAREAGAAAGRAAMKTHNRVKKLLKDLENNSVFVAHDATLSGAARVIAMVIEALQQIPPKDERLTLHRFVAEDEIKMKKVFTQKDEAPPHPTILISSMLNEFQKFYTEGTRNAGTNPQQLARIKDIIPRVAYSYLRACYMTETHDNATPPEAQAALNQAHALLDPGHKQFLESIGRCKRWTELENLAFSTEDLISGGSYHTHTSAPGTTAGTTDDGSESTIVLKGKAHGTWHEFSITHRHEGESSNRTTIVVDTE
jgi:hypothetical protein